MNAAISISAKENKTIMRQTKEVKIIVDTLTEHKAEDIAVVDVKERTPFADYYVLATAPNPRALSAYPDVLEEALANAKIEIRQVEGNPESEWVIIDAGAVVVQLFTAQKRSEMDLDTLLSIEKKK
jgi:ribosome-associated protein